MYVCVCVFHSSFFFVLRKQSNCNAHTLDSVSFVRHTTDEAILFYFSYSNWLVFLTIGGVTRRVLGIISPSASCVSKRSSWLQRETSLVVRASLLHLFDGWKTAQTWSPHDCQLCTIATAIVGNVRLQFSILSYYQTIYIWYDIFVTNFRLGVIVYGYLPRICARIVSLLKLV